MGGDWAAGAPAGWVQKLRERERCLLRLMFGMAWPAARPTRSNQG